MDLSMRLKGEAVDEDVVESEVIEMNVWTGPQIL